LFEQLISGLKPKLILDVGSYWGGSCIRMARLAREISPGDDVTVVAIDTWLGSAEHHLQMVGASSYGAMYTQFCDNIVRAGMADIVVPFPQNSVTAAQILTHYQIQPDLIYIDASHDYRSVLTDIENYWKILRVGGILFGDDFDAPWYGVIRAVLEFTDKHGVALQLSKAHATDANGVKQLNCKYVIQKRHV